MTAIRRKPKRKIVRKQKLVVRRKNPPPKSKKRITHGSAKAKGRRLQHWVCEQISELTGLEWGSAGQDKPIESRGMGQSGTDVRLESHAKKLFPFSVECKAQESMAVPAWVRQAQANLEKGTDWLLISKQSNKKPIVIMDAMAFFRILGRCK